MDQRRAPALAAAIGVVALLLAACGSSTPASPGQPPSSSGPSTVISSDPTSSSAPPTSGPTSSAQMPPAAPGATSSHAVPSGGAPVIVIDPGHSVSITATDPATGLNVSDYENEPEMRDVFAVALLVKAKLEADGYRVVLTKNSVDAPTSLGQRAAVANNAHAALALSIHDQAGSNGGLPFNGSNNIVYYQSVGNYRATPNGTKVTFTDASVAAASKSCGQVFQTRRAAVEGHSVNLLGNTGYDLGSRGLPAGNIWIVQLLSKVPWIYNEAGGNSAGMAGLNGTDKQRYADGLVAGVEHCVPVTH